MVDFTSALYLGMHHASADLPAWDQLTLGKPAALAEPPGMARVERELAALSGCEAVVLGVSTVHLLLDLFTMLAEPGVNIFLDESSYPIARWGVDRAAATGVPVRAFAAHDTTALRAAMAGSRQDRPVIVTDGYSPSRGSAASLANYSACAKGGIVVVDDSQALGIFGISGGGSLRRTARRLRNVVVVSSLAKAFGVPVAMLGGSAALVEQFRKRSLTRMHCSPQSEAVLAAARQALKHNRRSGDALRRRLALRVARFRKGLKELDLVGVPGLFPVQPLRLPEGISAKLLYRALLRQGIKTALVQHDGGLQIHFVLTARHRLEEIDRAIDALAGALRSVAQA